MIIHRLGENVSKLQFRRDVFHFDIPFGVIRASHSASEMVVLDCYVLCLRSEFYGFSHCDSRVVVLVNCKTKVCIGASGVSTVLSSLALAASPAE